MVLTGPLRVAACFPDRQAALPLQTGTALVKLISCMQGHSRKLTVLFFSQKSDLLFDTLHCVVGANYLLIRKSQPVKNGIDRHFSPVLYPRFRYRFRYISSLVAIPPFFAPNSVNPSYFCRRFDGLASFLLAFPASATVFTIKLNLTG